MQQEECVLPKVGSEHEQYEHSMGDTVMGSLHGSGHWLTPHQKYYFAFDYLKNNPVSHFQGINESRIDKALMHSISEILGLDKLLTQKLPVSHFYKGLQNLIPWLITTYIFIFWS